MGNIAVALLNYDRIHLIPNNALDVANAMKSHALVPTNKQTNRNFRFGAVISSDHSSVYQVVVVGRGTGYRLGTDTLPSHLLEVVASQLKSSGYKCKKDSEIRRLRKALETARDQLVILGGSANELYSDQIQKAVLSEVDSAILFKSK
jgi:hypothetical protein